MSLLIVLCNMTEVWWFSFFFFEVPKSWREWREVGEALWLLSLREILFSKTHLLWCNLLGLWWFYWILSWFWWCSLEKPWNLINIPWIAQKNLGGWKTLVSSWHHDVVFPFTLWYIATSYEFLSCNSKNLGLSILGMKVWMFELLLLPLLFLHHFSS